MSIHLKKIISIIPFINIIIIPFLWFRWYLKNPIPRKNFFKCILKCFLLCILITIPRIIIYKILGNGLVDTITTNISIILTMMFICIIMVKDEEEVKKTD